MISARHRHLEKTLLCESTRVFTARNLHLARRNTLGESLLLFSSPVFSARKRHLAQRNALANTWICVSTQMLFCQKSTSGPKLAKGATPQTLAMGATLFPPNGEWVEPKLSNRRMGATLPHIIFGIVCHPSPPNADFGGKQASSCDKPQTSKYTQPEMSRNMLTISHPVETIIFREHET
jgi:hypothetical protein